MTHQIVTLIGSTRFPSAFQLAEMHYAALGYVVQSVNIYGHSDLPTGARFLTDSNADSNPFKAVLDSVHRAKIEMADVIVVINVGGYLGDGTRREIKYAEELGKRVHYLLPQLV